MSVFILIDRFTGFFKTSEVFRKNLGGFFKPQSVFKRNAPVTLNLFRSQLFNKLFKK